ncbi:RNA polymerase sigma factor [Streptosporangium sandarakinum]|uniref:RNA polymerase sigma factor n=1 Tax=Streptosporangium sandarakinum TaxID=1260955 RepID=UPI003710BB8C
MTGTTPAAKAAKAAKAATTPAAKAATTPAAKATTSASAASAAAVAGAVAAAGADAYPRIVAALIRVTSDWTLAEDCAQEALTLALQRWPREGVPGNPGGWLMTVARNRAIDVLRRASAERRKLAELAALALTDPGPASEEPPAEEVVDDRLRLIFTCCHPALSMEARVALTLRTVCGVPTADIARVFLVGESAMTRRLTRAKTRIADAGIPYRVPTGPALAERLPGVLAVLYLLFTHGYNADGRPAFADEAIRLARLLRELMPGEGEVTALLALFLFQHSRRDARRDDRGDLLTLDRQDRRRWDRAAIAEGLRLLAETPQDGPYAPQDDPYAPEGGAYAPQGDPYMSQDGPYALQARIAARHATAASADATDWPAIAACYDRLARIQPSPVVELNRAVAHGYAHGPEAGLALLAGVRAGGALDGHPLVVAVEADLTARRGGREDHDRAAALFRQAAAAAHSEPERRALLDRADESARRHPAGGTAGH